MCDIKYVCRCDRPKFLFDAVYAANLLTEIPNYRYPKYLPKYRITDTEILTEIPNYRYRNTYTEILTKIHTFPVHDTFSTQVSRLGSFESCFLSFILCCSDFWPIVFLTMHVPLVTYVHDLMHGSVHLPLVRH